MRLEISAMVGAALVGSGILLAALGLSPVDAPLGRPSRADGLRRRWSGIPARTRALAAAGLAAGVLAAALGGWVVAIPLLPAAMVGVPWLLSSGGEPRQIQRLKAMEEWTRTLSGTLTAGMSLEQAVALSLPSTPDPVRPEVARLVGRLNAHWNTPDALRDFAADLDDAVGDQIVASLTLGARQRADGLPDILTALADSVADSVKERQRTFAERATTRTTTRGVTLVTVAVLVGLAFSGSYIAPYKTPAGQAALVALLGLHVAVLLLVKRMSRVPPAPRFLFDPEKQKAR